MIHFPVWCVCLPHIITPVSQCAERSRKAWTWRDTNAQIAWKEKKKTANIYHTDLSLSLSVCLLSCSKYRPQSSEPQTDGLSVSTTADGSQPNVRKLCDTPPPAPQAHTHNLAYYDNIICQVRPTLSFFSPPIQQSFILYLSASEISSHFTFSSYPLCSGPLPCFLSTSLIGFCFLPVSTHARLSEC